MTEYWIFSPSSQLYLERCLAATKPPDPNNKWIKRFKKKYDFLNKAIDDNNENSKTNIVEVPDSDSESPPAETTKILDSESSDQILECVENEAVAKFDFMVEKCIKSPGTISKLAKNLSINTIEKISNHLLNLNNKDLIFLDLFLTEFIPTFLRRENCRFSLDLLVSANRTHPVEFKKTVNIILKDTKITNTILHEFAQTLDQDGKLQFLNNIIESNLTIEEFQHNLLTVLTVYKECKKNCYLQSYMENLLFENSELCATDKNFGKLLLAFLQEQKNYGAFKQSKLIEKAIEVNKTPFKKPCLNVYKEIIERLS